MLLLNAGPSPASATSYGPRPDFVQEGQSAVRARTEGATR